MFFTKKRYVTEIMKKKGFVIANDKEEFLAEFKHNADYSLRKWAITPELALVFHSRLKAQEAVKNIQDDVNYRLWILELFDMGKQLAVGTEDEDKPDWLT